MTFSPVIPPSYRTDRADLRAAIGAMVDAFIQSESYQIGRMFLSEMPDNFMAEGPLIVISDIGEEVVHDIQTRTSTFRGSLYWIDVFPDHDEYARRVDIFADHMRDLFTYNARLVDPAAGELYQAAFSEEERSQGPFTFGTPHVDFVYRVQVGRP